MSTNKKTFIEQTANDYDMSYDDVECIYNMYHNSDPLNFYLKLEEFITNRANKID
jgi:hypothetical protein